MTTQKQIEANRRNATKSTGPTTPEGKALSSRNALKHGILAQQVVIHGEDMNDFCDLEQRLIAEYRPEGVLERELVDQMVAILWRLRRLRKVEAGIFAVESDKPPLADIVELRLEFEECNSTEEEEDPEPPDETELSQLAEYDKVQRSLGLAFIRDGHGANAFSKLSRYEASSERSFYRALHELQRVQSARKGAEVPAPAVVDLNIDVGTVVPLDRS